MKAQMISLTGRRKKKLERQVEKYLTALKSHRTDYKLQIELGNTYAELEDQKRSINAYYAAIDLLRQTQNIGKTRATVIELYEKMLQLAPRDPKVYLDLSEEYLSAGQKEKAFRFLLSSAKKAYEEENYDVALQCYNQAIAKGRSSPHIVERCTELYIKLGRKDEAMQNYIKIGDMYAQDEKNIEALEYYKKACSVDPNNPELLLKVARMYNAMAWTENAASELVKVGEFYEQQQDQTEALRYYQYSIRLDPENERAQEGRRRISEQFSVDGIPLSELAGSEERDDEEQTLDSEMSDMIEPIDLNDATQAEFELTTLDEGTLTFQDAGRILDEAPYRQPEEAVSKPLFSQAEEAALEFGLNEAAEPDFLPLEQDDTLLVLHDEESEVPVMDFFPNAHTDTETLVEEDAGFSERGFNQEDPHESELLLLENDEQEPAASDRQIPSYEPELLTLEEEDTGDGFGLTRRQASEHFSADTQTLFMTSAEAHQPPPSEWDHLPASDLFLDDAHALPSASAQAIAGPQGVSGSAISLEDWIIDLKEDELVELALEEALRDQETSDDEMGQLFGINLSAVVEPPRSGERLSLPEPPDQGEEADFVRTLDNDQDTVFLSAEEDVPTVAAANEDFTAHPEQFEPTPFIPEEASQFSNQAAEAEFEFEPPHSEAAAADELEFDEALFETVPDSEPEENTEPEEELSQILDVYLHETPGAEEAVPVEATWAEPEDIASAEVPLLLEESQIEPEEIPVEAEEALEDEAWAEIETEDESAEQETLPSELTEILHQLVEQENVEEMAAEETFPEPEPDADFRFTRAAADAETQRFASEREGAAETRAESDEIRRADEFLKQALEQVEMAESETSEDIVETGASEERPEPEDVFEEEDEVVTFLEDSTELTPEMETPTEMEAADEIAASMDETSRDFPVTEAEAEDEMLTFLDDTDEIAPAAETERTASEEMLNFLDESMEGSESERAEEATEPPMSSTHLPGASSFTASTVDLHRRIDDLQQQLERTEEEKYFLQERFAAQISQHKAHEEALQKEISEVYHDKEELEKRLQHAVKGIIVSRKGGKPAEPLEEPIEIPKVQSRPSQPETPQPDAVAVLQSVDRTPKPTRFDETRYQALVSKIESKKFSLQQQLHELLKQREANGQFLNQELTALNTTKQRLQQNLADMQKTKVRLEERINTEVRQAKLEVQTLTKTTHELETKLKAQQQAEQTLRKQFQLLSREKEALQENYAQSLQTLKTEKDELEQQLQHTSKAKTVVEKTLKKKLHSVYRSYQHIKAEYNQALESKETQIAESAQHLSEFADRYVKLEKTLAEIRKERDRLNTMLSQEVATREMLEGKLENIETQVDSLEVQGSKLMTQLGQELDRHFKLEQRVSDKFQLSLDEMEGLLALQEQEIHSLETL